MAAEVKGVLLNAQLLFMKTNWGDAQVDAAMATLQSDDAKLLGQRFLDSGWYPQQTEVAMRRLIRAMPPRAGNVPLEVGAFIAEHAFTRVYSSLLTKDVGRMV